MIVEIAGQAGHGVRFTRMDLQGRDIGPELPRQVRVPIRHELHRHHPGRVDAGGLRCGDERHATVDARDVAKDAIQRHDGETKAEHEDTDRDGLDQNAAMDL